MGKFRQILTVICLLQDNGGVISHFLFYFKDQFRDTGSCENFILGYVMRTS